MSVTSAPWSTASRVPYPVNRAAAFSHLRPGREESRRSASPRRRRRQIRQVRRARRLRRLCFALAMLCVVFGALAVGNRCLFQEPEISQAERAAQTVVYQYPATVAAWGGGEEQAPLLPAAGEAHLERKDGFYTFLVAGVDDHNGGSDTIILGSVDAKSHAFYGLSIPRDTKAVLGDKPCKLNAAYNRGGMDLLSRTVTAQLGIPVDYTVEVNLSGFAALVDAVGGVDFDVPLDMDYDDPVQDLHIHVQKGMQHLDGATALQVVRFRHNNDGTGYGSEDYGRIGTQQRFLKTAAKQLLTPASVTKLDEFARILDECVTTDLTVQNIAWLAKEALAAGVEGVEFATLPGQWRSPYVYTDRTAALEIVNAHLNPYVEPRTAADLHLPS